MSQMRRTRRRENQVRTVHNDAARHFAPADAGRLVPEAPTERTHKTSQRDIAAATSANAAANAWRQPLNRGPYSVKFSRTGRHAVLAGHGGHARVLDLHENRATCDVRPGEIVRDACFLHDERLFAVAQKKYFRRADSPRTSRGAAAAATWIFRGDESRRGRGRDVDITWRRVAAPLRVPRG